MGGMMFAKGWSQSRLSSRVSKWRCMFTGLTNVSGLLFLPCYVTGVACTAITQQIFVQSVSWSNDQIKQSRAYKRKIVDLFLEKQYKAKSWFQTGLVLEEEDVDTIDTIILLFWAAAVFCLLFALSALSRDTTEPGFADAHTNQIQIYLIFDIWYFGVFVAADTNVILSLWYFSCSTVSIRSQPHGLVWYDY